MKKLLLIIVVILLFACKQREENTTLPVNVTDTIVTEKETLATEHLNEQIDDTIDMVEDRKGNFSAIGTIDSIHPRIYVKFSNKAVGNLKASITAMEGDGNIRFNQIIFPDKTADGPFGKEMEHELKTTGEHILIIGHSLMADGQYEGKFKVDLQLTDTP